MSLELRNTGELLVQLAVNTMPDRPLRLLDIDDVLYKSDMTSEVETIHPVMDDAMDWDYLPFDNPEFDIILVGESLIRGDLLGWHLCEFARVTKSDAKLCVQIPEGLFDTLRFKEAPYIYTTKHVIRHARIQGWRLVHSRRLDDGTRGNLLHWLFAIKPITQLLFEKGR